MSLLRNVIETLQIPMSYLCNVGNDHILLYISKMVPDNHILLFVHLRSIFLTWVALEMPLCYEPLKTLDCT